MPILECLDLSVNFGGLKAVDSVNFGVEDGQIFSVIGPNGAGKTTVFNLLTGFIKPTSGKILYKGHDIVGMKPWSIAEKGITRTYQHTSVFPGLSVLENTQIGFHRLQKANLLDAVFHTNRWKMGEDESIEKGKKVLDFLELTPYTNELAGNLGYGQLRLLEIAISLCLDPTLLLLDEPAAGMNPDEAKHLMELIRKIRSLGITVMLVEHNMRLVMEISDLIMVMDHGSRICLGTPGEVANDDCVIKSYLGGGHTNVKN